MNWRGIVMKSNCMSKIQFLLIKPVENTTSVVEIERAFDEALFGITYEIEELCKSLKETAIRNTWQDSEKAKIKDVTRNILISWGVLKEECGKVYPTNAYALLTGRWWGSQLFSVVCSREPIGRILLTG